MLPTGERSTWGCYSLIRPAINQGKLFYPTDGRNGLQTLLLAYCKLPDLVAGLINKT